MTVESSRVATTDNPNSKRPTSTPDEAPSLPPVVELRGVEKTFNAGTEKAFTAIRDVDVCVEDKPEVGELIGIVGPSGCGKSTILNLIQGFSDVYPPTAGEVLVRGKPVVGPGRDRGMVFQRYSSFPNRTVLRNVTFGLELGRAESGLSRSQMDALALEWIHKVGLGGHEKKYPHQLSGGQQQRVAIARTLVLKPRIVLMDEPFSALDEPTRYEMQRLTTQLWHELEATMFIVTHSLTEAVFLSDRVWLMSNAPGRIVREFDELLPPTHDADPLEVQATGRFKDALGEVTHAFHRVEDMGRS